ncbi:MAG TPA: membrane dipeptidase [Candidatus Acidoferrales bacterium]|nr:membrane dipeptidase [Candidatus Acidoferrales bacterium]
MPFNRRKFLVAAGQAMCVAGFSPAILSTLVGAGSAAAASAQEAVQDDLDALYRGAIVIDSLCAPVHGSRIPLPAEDLEQAKSSGITAVNFTVSDPQFEETVIRVAFAHTLEERHPDTFLIVRRHIDIARAKQEDKVGVVLGFQHASPFDSDFARMEAFRRLDVRIMQLTYNNRSLLGDGCLEPSNAGLSRVGHEAVQRMNAMGIAVDTSHSGKQTTLDAIDASAKPILISHGGCDAVHAHPRNKDDESLRKLATRGGYFGVFLMPYLSASPAVPTEEDVLRHVEHALDVCGADHVGIGSDGEIATFSLTEEQRKAFEEDMAQRKRAGIAAPEEDRFPYVPDLSTNLRMEKIAAGLRKRGQPWPVVEKVLGANFHRTIGEIWGTT